jgi:tetratricopeptide (TPR) repeat protein
MVFRLSSSVARVAIAFAAFLLAAALAYSSIRNARAAHNVGLQTLQGYEKATQLEPGNPLNWYLLGHYWLFNLEEPDTPRAINAYRTALSLDPRSANTWMDLAAAYESQGDLQAARDAFHQATRVYPLSAEVSWRYGNFLLRQGELPQAFSEIRHAVEVDPQRAAEAFSRSWRVDPDVEAILDKVLPPTEGAYLDAIRELDFNEEVAPALSVWARLVALHPHLKVDQVFPFIDMLLRTHHTADARHVWDQAVGLAALPSPGDPVGSVLWDGGFETGVRGGGFSWSVSPYLVGVQIGSDTKTKHSGNQSLRLGFDGRRNINFSDVCNFAEVQPSTAYRFSGWVRTQSLTTNQGIRFRLIWLENSQATSLDTSDVHGTQPWTKIEMPWTSGKDVHSVRVCISRNPADEFNIRIQGTAWVDDVSLVPQSAVDLKP